MARARFGTQSRASRRRFAGEAGSGGALACAAYVAIVAFRHFRPRSSAGAEFPNLHVVTDLGEFDMHDYITGWTVLFSHPKVSKRGWGGDAVPPRRTRPTALSPYVTAALPPTPPLLQDYTPVCTTELGEAARIQADFTARGVKLIALSCDSVEDHM